MKKALFILLFVLGFCIQKGNAQKSSYKENVSSDSTICPAVLKVTIVNAPTKKFALIYNDQRQKANLDAEGNYTFSLELHTPSYAELDFEFLDHKCLKVFLLPGKTLFLTCNASDLDKTALFSGDGATENNGLLVLQAQYAQINYEQLFYGSDSTQFVKLLQAQRMNLVKTLTDYARNHSNLDPEFQRLEMTRIVFWEASARIRRSEFYKDGNWIDYISKLDFNVNDPNLLNIDTYYNFLHQYINAKANERITSDPVLKNSINQQTEARYSVIVGTITNIKVRNVLLYQVLRIHLAGNPNQENGPLGCKGIEGLMIRFDRDCTDKVFREEIDSLYHQCQKGRNAPIIKVYKTIGTITLDAHIFPASGAKPSERRSAFLFFHGGGWRIGMPEWGYEECKYYANQGLVGISFEYRIQQRHGTTIIESVEDAKSAVRWVRSHADELGIDPDRIVATGFSSGSYLAAVVGIAPGCDDPEDDKTVSAVPNALVLNSAPLDVLWDDIAGRDPANFSPACHVRPGLPPSIVFHGRDDQFCPFTKTDEFCNKMKAAGNRCELCAFKGGHFRNGADWAEINQKTDEFLKSSGFLGGK